MALLASTAPQLSEEFAARSIGLSPTVSETSEINMSVFLSHKREDSQAAKSIAIYLASRDISFYLDVFDPALRTTSDLTESLQENIHRCTHLMAVVSDYTTNSWWVPFEIGVATEINRRVSTYQLSPNLALPDYLTKWPILRSLGDLGRFADVYQLDLSVEFKNKGVETSTREGADNFHRALINHLQARG